MPNAVIRAIIAAHWGAAQSQAVCAVAVRRTHKPLRAVAVRRNHKPLRAARARVTTAGVDTGAGRPGDGSGQAAVEAGGKAMRAWDAIRADRAIQYAPVKLPEAAPPPDWLTRLFEYLGKLFAPIVRVIAGNWSVIWPVLAVLAGLLVLYVIVRLVAPDLIGRRRRKPDKEEVVEWTPGAAAARALLEDADRLAAEGRFDEATRLLLTRSVGQIAELRPELVEPSSTAREIAALPALPEAARTAFAIIAARVERSLFALRRLSAEDWQAARADYADFALASGHLVIDRSLAA